ncbi:MAG: hypothetical protein LQ352_000485 [Teloschistes flavicans]|nr:MAG: hypothetical protein LQ352_000485 [Teloschistes flavicans]
MDPDDGLRREFAQHYAPLPQRKKIVLCFDGTGNKFSGTDADSNILKIFRMLDRSNGVDEHYYQPGIGTYVNTTKLSHTTWTTRLNSWYYKAKDSAVGSSFDVHVMGGYKFLMRCYQDDDIFIFGFSRGAYVARFLADMLDHVGLLSRGNEEMAYFAWKAFAQWKERQEGSEEEKIKKHELYQFLKNFRETFSRPVRRIRFMGLFDTVNSVPRFENAWMQRSKFPYTARSSAKVIRHAVSIDERRAKFRSDLISDTKASEAMAHHRRHHRHHHYHLNHPHGENAEKHMNGSSTDIDAQSTLKPPQPDRFRRPSQIRSGPNARKQSNLRLEIGNDSQADDRKTRREMQRLRSLSPNAQREGSLSLHTAGSQISLISAALNEDENDLDEADDQDVEELWFPGCHADLGGGWPLGEGEETALSHGPLVWMVREAQRAGLPLDREKMIALHCCDLDPRMLEAKFPSTAPPQDGPPIPTFEVTTPSQPDLFRSPHSAEEAPGWRAGLEPKPAGMSKFHQRLHHSAAQGVLHDCLEFNNGLPRMSVLSWKMMEYMPFRRMDLQTDGSWKAITFPLPMGEVRDMPEDAKVHHSAIKRMEANEDYRPGNLIIGGGGRGVRKAPKQYGIGEWIIHKNQGDPVGEVYVRKGKSVNQELKDEGKLF